MFFFHVLIFKEEKQLFPRCNLLFVIWIQVIVIFSFIYICFCYKYLCSSAQPNFSGATPPPPPTKQCTVNIAAIVALWRGKLSCVNVVDPCIVYYCSDKICQPFVHQCPELTNLQKMKLYSFYLVAWWFLWSHPETVLVNVKTQNVTKYRSLLLDSQLEFLSNFLLFDSKQLRTCLIRQYILLIKQSLHRDFILLRSWRMEEGCYDC